MKIQTNLYAAANFSLAQVFPYEIKNRWTRRLRGHLCRHRSPGLYPRLPTLHSHKNKSRPSI